jgi:hypothetical protein
MTSSMSFLLAPMTLTGLAALSVETQKKCAGGASDNNASRRPARMTLLSIMASME